MGTRGGGREADFSTALRFGRNDDSFCKGENRQPQLLYGWLSAVGPPIANCATDGHPAFEVKGRRSNGNRFVAVEKLTSGLDEGEEVGVDDVGVDLAHAVGEAWIDLELGVLHDLGRLQTGGNDGNDLVVFAVEDERWDVDLL